MVLHRYRISNPYVLKNIDNPKFTQTAKSNLENKDSKTGVLNLQGCKSVDVSKGRYGGSWIHPDLAVQLDQ